LIMNSPGESISGPTTRRNRLAVSFWDHFSPRRIDPHKRACVRGTALRVRRPISLPHSRSAQKGSRGSVDVRVRTSRGTAAYDVYDPITQEIRSRSTEDVACWFIDTEYNGESFFVRHAYFTGADQPYDKLKRALRADVDEAAWAALYATTSRPFPPPKTKKIAVKLINHYGDEVLKVFNIDANIK